MITYFKMKKAEWKIKAALYGTIAALIDNQKEILDFVQAMYIALKDIPAENLQKEFVSKLAEIIHEEGRNKND